MFKKCVLVLMALVCGMALKVGVYEVRAEGTADIYVSSAEEFSNKEYSINSKIHIEKDIEIENVTINVTSENGGAVFYIEKNANVTLRNIAIKGEYCGRLVQVEKGSSVVIDGLKSDVETGYIVRNYGEMHVKDLEYTGTSTNGMQNDNLLTLEKTNITKIFLNPGGVIMVNKNTKLENEIEINWNKDNFSVNTPIVKGDGVYAGCFIDKFKLGNNSFDLDYSDKDEDANGISKGDLYLVANGQAKTDKPDWLVLPEEEEPTEPIPEEKEETVTPTPVEPTEVEVNVAKDTFEYNGSDHLGDIQASYEYDGNTYTLELEKVEVKDAQEYEVNILFNEESANYDLVKLNKTSIKVVVTPKEVGIRYTQSSLVYTGQEIEVSASIEWLVDGDICNVKLTNAQKVEAKEYEVEASIDNANYKISEDSKTYKFCIGKACVNIADTEIKKLEFGYSGKEIKLENYTTANGIVLIKYIVNKEIRNGGEYEVGLEYELTNSNYTLPQALKQSVKVEVTKRKIVPVLKTSEFVYNGQAPNLEIYFSDVVEGDRVEYTLEREEVVNVGEDYSVKVVLVSNENYCIKTDKEYVNYKITKASIDESKISFSNISKEYDGKEVTFKNENICDGLVLVEYVTNNTSIVNNGTYIVKILLQLLDEDNYTQLKKTEYSISVNISQREIIPSLKEKDYIYSKEAPRLEFVFQNVVEGDEIKYTYIADENVFVGEHEVSVQLDYTDPQTSRYVLSQTYQTLKYNISKKKIDTSACKFEDKKIEYGEDVKIKVENLPSGVKPVYQNIPDSKVVGEYEITARFMLEDTHNFYLDKEYIVMWLIVTPKEIDITGINMADKKCLYDGKIYTIEPPEIEGAKFTPQGETEFSDVGEHKIRYIMSNLNANYKLIGESMELTATLRITPADYDISSIEFSDKEVFYDTNPHSIEYIGHLPEGLEAHLCKSYIDAGSHEITLEFESTNPNYLSPLPMKATLKILQRKIDVLLKEKTFTYTGESIELSCTVNGVLDGDSVEVQLDYAKNIDVGEYMASIKSLSNANYIPSSETLTYNITKAKSDISNLNLPSEEYTYSNKEYIPRVYGTMPGYLSYKIEMDDKIRNVGEYEVRVKFEADKNHEVPDDLVAKIKIKPKEIQIYFSDYMDLKYTGEKQYITVDVSGMLDNEGVVVTYSQPPIEAGNYTCKVTLKENSNYIISGDNTCVFNIYLEQKEVTNEDYTISLEGGIFTADSELKIQSTKLSTTTKQSLDNMYESLDICKCFSILSEAQENEVKINVSLNTLSLNSDYVLYLISPSGELTKLDYELKGNTLIFQAPTNSTFVLLKEKTPTSKTLYIVLLSILSLSLTTTISIAVWKTKKKRGKGKTL